MDIQWLIKMLPFWEHLDDEEKQILIDATREVHYSQGQNIYHAQEQCVGIILLRTGEIRTYMLSEDGRDITLYRLYGGDVCILSASCILHNITFDVNIDAERDSDAYVIDTAAFAYVQSKNVYVDRFALQTAADKFSDVMWAMEQILFMSLDQRLAVFLLDESAKTGSLALSLTHEQIARYMGSAREAVSRMLKYFEKEGYVTLQRGGLTIVSKEKLQKLIRKNRP